MHLKPALHQTTGSLRFQTGEDVRRFNVSSSSGGSLAPPCFCFCFCERYVRRQCQVRHLKELVFVEGLDPPPKQQCLDIRILVQVSDFGNHAEADGYSRLALHAPPVGKRVEEAISSAIFTL